MVFLALEGEPDGEGEGEDEVVVFGLVAIGTEGDELGFEFGEAGRGGREGEFLGAEGGAEAGE